MPSVRTVRVKSTGIGTECGCGFSTERNEMRREWIKIENNNKEDERKENRNKKSKKRCRGHRLSGSTGLTDRDKRKTSRQISIQEISKTIQCFRLVTVVQSLPTDRLESCHVRLIDMCIIECLRLDDIADQIYVYIYTRACMYVSVYRRSRRRWWGTAPAPLGGSTTKLGCSSPRLVDRERQWPPKLWTDLVTGKQKRQTKCSESVVQPLKTTSHNLKWATLSLSNDDVVNQLWSITSPAKRT